MNVSLGEDGDPVVPVDHEDLGVAVGVDGVVGEPDQDKRLEKNRSS